MEGSRLEELYWDKGGKSGCARHRDVSQSFDGVYCGGKGYGEGLEDGGMLSLEWNSTSVRQHAGVRPCQLNRQPM